MKKVKPNPYANNIHRVTLNGKLKLVQEFGVRIKAVAQNVIGLVYHGNFSKSAKPIFDVLVYRMIDSTTAYSKTMTTASQRHMNASIQ